MITMVAVIAEISAGLDPAARQLLESQAQAVDMARGKGDAAKLTHACRGMFFILRGYGLVNRPATGADPFDAFLADVLGDG